MPILSSKCNVRKVIEEIDMEKVVFNKLPLALAVSAILVMPNIVMADESLPMNTMTYDGTDESLLNRYDHLYPIDENGEYRTENSRVIIDFSSSDPNIKQPSLVYGGHSTSDNKVVVNNEVIIKDGTVRSNIIGSNTMIDSTDNVNTTAIAEGKVVIHDGNVGGVSGAEVRIYINDLPVSTPHIGKAIGSLDIHGGTIRQAAAGSVVSNNRGEGEGYSEGTVNMTGGTLDSFLYGAYASGRPQDWKGMDAQAIGTINFSGGLVKNSVYGAYITNSQTADSLGVLNVSGGEIQGHVYTAFASSSGNLLQSSALARGTTVMTDGIMGKNFVSARAFSLGRSEAKGSMVMTGGEIKSTLYGAFSSVSTSSALENSALARGTVEVSNAIIGKDIRGAEADSHYLADAQSVLEITDTSVGGNILGARVTIHEAPAGTTDIEATAKGIGNIITLDGKITLGDETEIWGASINGVTTYKDGFTGNILNIHSNPLTVSKLGNFENYNFYLTKNNEHLVNSDTAMITVKDQLHNEDSWILAGSGLAADKEVIHNKSNILLKGISGENSVKIGDSIHLISAKDAKLTQGEWDATQGNLVETEHMSDLFNTGEKHNIQIGLAGKIGVEYEIDDDTKLISAKFVTDRDIDEDLIERNVKPLVEGRISALMNVTRKVDLEANVLRDFEKGQVTPFVTLKGGRDRYQSGSHITANIFDFMMGAGYRYDALSVAGFISYGYDDYKTYNQFFDGRVKGKGHNSSYGLGFSGAYDFSNDIYALFGAQVGRIETKFGSDDIITGSGQTAHYKSKVTYYSGYLGAGYRYDLTSGSALDTSLRYMYSHLGSDGITIDGDAIQFQSLKSSRIELKTQYEKVFSDEMKLNTSLAYQYEFDGKGDANIAGISIDAPGMKGSTGVVGVGFEYQPKSDDAKSFLNRSKINVDVQGYFGKRRGGSLALTYRYMLK